MSSEDKATMLKNTIGQLHDGYNKSFNIERDINRVKQEVQKHANAVISKSPRYKTLMNADEEKKIESLEREKMKSMEDIKKAKQLMETIEKERNVFQTKWSVPPYNKTN